MEGVVVVAAVVPVLEVVPTEEPLAAAGADSPVMIAVWMLRWSSLVCIFVMYVFLRCAEELSVKGEGVSKIMLKV